MKSVGRFIVNLFLIALVLVIGVGLYFTKMGQVMPGSWLASKKAAGLFVTGTGEEAISPDLIEVYLGTSVMATEVSSSFNQANKTIDKIKGVVTKLGIEDKDVQTNRYTIYPEFTWVDNDQNLKGYRTEHILKINVRDIAKINDVIAQSVDAGANRIENINFTMADPKTIQAKAREKALQDAAKKAEDMATALGARVGQVISVEDVSVSNPNQLASKIMPEAGGMGAGPSVSPGQLIVTVNVNVNYAFKY